MVNKYKIASKVHNGPLTLTPHLKKWVPHHNINVPEPENVYLHLIDGLHSWHSINSVKFAPNQPLTIDITVNVSSFSPEFILPGDTNN